MIAVGRIPIRINPLFWVTSGAIGLLASGGEWSVAFIWLAVIFVSILFHEFGHALTALAYGQRVSIELMALGGLTFRQGPALSPFREFMVVLNGPLAGFLLAGITVILQYMFEHTHFLVDRALDASFAVNLGWTCLNLLPIQPLDGGKLLIIVMEAMFGLRGVKIALFAGLVLSTFLGLFLFTVGNMLGGAILFMFAFEGYRTWKGSLVMTDKDRDQQLLELLKSAEDLYHMGKIDQSEKVLQQIRAEVKTGFLFLASTQLLAQIATKRGEYPQAYQLLRSIEDHLEDNDLVLLHQLAYRNQQWKHVSALGDRIHQNVPSYETAILNALAHAVLGEVEPAIGWLRCAVEEGLPNPKHVAQQKEFDSLRSNPDFQQFVSTL